MLVVVFGALVALAARAAAAPISVEADRTLSAIRDDLGLAIDDADDAAPAGDAGAIDDADGAAPAGDAGAIDDAGGAVPAGAIDDAGGAAPAGALDDAGGAAPAGAAGASDADGAAPRRPRASRWGRLELAVVWRRRLDDAADASRRDQLWLLATWSR